MREKASNRTGDGKRQRRGATKPASTRRRSPSKSAHPHDRLFKEVFSTVEAQQDLVRMALPEEITSRFRIDTVRDAGQESGSGRADLVLSVETVEGATEYVDVLVEHKSKPASLVAVQLLGYVADILKRTQKPPVPIVHPVVFYHGKQKWNVPTELTDLHVSGGPRHARTDTPTPTSIDHPVNLRYHLFDLNAIPPEEIAKRTRARAYLGMIVMKYALQRKLRDLDIRVIAATVVRSKVPEDLGDTMTIYLYRHVPERYKQRLLTAIDETVYTEEEGRRMKSIADVLQEEGLVKGLEQGIERGKADVLVRLLHRRFGITPEEETVVRDCHDPDRLDAAAEVFADAPASKDEILALLK